MSAEPAEPIGPAGHGGGPDDGSLPAVAHPPEAPRRPVRTLRLVRTAARPATATAATSVIPAIAPTATTASTASTATTALVAPVTVPPPGSPSPAAHPAAPPAAPAVGTGAGPAVGTATTTTDLTVVRAAEAVRTAWARLADAEAEVAHWFGALLFSLAPALRGHFPAQADPAARRLLRTTIAAMSAVDRPAELATAIPPLARELRALGLDAGADEPLGVALVGAVRRFAGDAWAPDADAAWVRAFSLAARPARVAVAALPGVVGATVVTHRRLSWDLAVVEVEPDVRVDFRPGQSVTVEVPQRPRMWRHLTPAGAPRADGRLEFHVRAVDGGWVSRSLVAHSRVGERWRIGPAEGGVVVDPGAERELLLVVGGTGASVALALCEELVGQAAAGVDVRPTTVVVGGRTPEDLHTLDRFADLAVGEPWLAVVGACESDPLDTELAPGTVVEAVSRSGPWLDHDVVVAGSPAMIRATTAALLVDGTPLDRIHYDPFTDDEG
ncbi:FAD-binding oxidoreductase [Actinomycetospora soli]|uniref:FAD-binding oxidoreductase n=1 Tax=Actinomycetospora soli TaxID=2893887 RepID=UPI001E4733D5|nr:FAD-binding oxidoreductase [Actinomycetospora soli]MCD2186271.1 FAD-binding oxidoreductase [Actinomycetospora soli]